MMLLSVLLKKLLLLPAIILCVIGGLVLVDRVRLFVSTCSLKHYVCWF
jgi:hypothetical protein